MLTIYRVCHQQSDKDNLYVKINSGGRGLISVEDAVNNQVKSLRK